MSAITADDMRATINEWADKRGFRPEIPYAESTSLKYQRRFSCVPGLYVFIFTNGDIFVGMADDLGETLTRQPEQWVSEISGVRLMARSKKALSYTHLTLPTTPNV